MAIKRFRCAFLCVGLFVIAAFCVSIWNLVPQFNGYDKWIPVETKAKDIEVIYPISMIDRAKILFAEIQKVDLKVKFIKPTKSSPDYAALGYIGEIELGPLADKDIPLTLRPRVVGAYYSVSVGFDLLDKDGFRLMTVFGPNNNMLSGKTTKLQEIIQDKIPCDIIKKIKKINPTLHIVDSFPVTR